MKILLVSRRYYPDVKGGGQISAHQIAQSLVGAGHDVKVCTFITQGPRIDEVLDGVHVTRMPIRTLRWFPRLSNMEWMYREMERVLHPIVTEFKPDLLHSLNGESAPSVRSIARKYDLPYVVTINGPTLLCFTQQGTDINGNNCLGCRGRQRFSETMRIYGRTGILSKVVAFFYWLYSYPHMAVYSRALRDADMLLPGSKDFRQRVVSLGYPPERVRVVYNPIGPRKRVPTTLKRDLHIPAHSPVLLYAGRLANNKGIDLIINSLKLLPTAHFIIAGQGDAIQSLEHLVRSNNIAERVHFVGYVDNADLPRYYCAADIVIMAGDFYENFSRMLLEACAYGVPIIAPAIGGNPDIIEHGKNGFLLQRRDSAEVADYVTQIIKDPALARRMGAYGRALVAKHFSLARTGADLSSIYSEILHRVQ